MIPRSVRFFIVLYSVALVVLAVIALSLLGVLPFRFGSVEGLTDTQSLLITLGLMVVVGLRLFLHFRRRPAPPADAQTPD